MDSSDRISMVRETIALSAHAHPLARPHRTNACPPLDRDAQVARFRRSAGAHVRNCLESFEEEEEEEVKCE